MKRVSLDINITNMCRNVLNESTSFYHVTTIERWEKIKNEGLNSDEQGQIFVSSQGELSILLGIAMLQLPEISKSKEIVFLKLPQNQIRILETEIVRDSQTNEWTKKFQYVIYRSNIPINQIENIGSLYLGEVNPVKDSLAEIFRCFMIQYFSSIQEDCCQFYMGNGQNQIGDDFKTLQSNKIEEIISKLRGITISAFPKEDQENLTIQIEHNISTLESFM